MIGTVSRMERVRQVSVRFCHYGRGGGFNRSPLLMSPDELSEMGMALRQTRLEAGDSTVSRVTESTNGASRFLATGESRLKRLTATSTA